MPPAARRNFHCGGANAAASCVLCCGFWRIPRRATQCGPQFGEGPRTGVLRVRGDPISRAFNSATSFGVITHVRVNASRAPPTPRRRQPARMAWGVRPCTERVDESPEACSRNSVVGAPHKEFLSVRVYLCAHLMWHRKNGRALGRWRSSSTWTVSNRPTRSCTTADKLRAQQRHRFTSTPRGRPGTVCITTDHHRHHRQRPPLLPPHPDPVTSKVKSLRAIQAHAVRAPRTASCWSTIAKMWRGWLATATGVLVDASVGIGEHHASEAIARLEACLRRGVWPSRLRRRTFETNDTADRPARAHRSRANAWPPHEM